MAEQALLIPAVVGPTASGKTALSIALCRRLEGEILCCDSMQIYRKMDIGTAKPTKEERAAVPHHLCDFLDPGTPYSAADYAADAARAVREVTARGRIPVFCGGTGLYLAAARRGEVNEEIPGTTAHRARLEAIARGEGGTAELYRQLREHDPESAAATHENNVRRVIRALEVFYATGIPKSEWDRRSREKEPALHILPFALRYDREKLYARIEARVDAMIAEGLLHEVRSLYEEGLLSPTSTAAQAIGYKEFAAHLRGECSLEEAVLNLKTATRRYAKRQLTWFAADPSVLWLDAEDAQGRPRGVEEITEQIIAVYREKGGKIIHEGVYHESE